MPDESPLIEQLEVELEVRGSEVEELQPRFAELIRAAIPPNKTSPALLLETDDRAAADVAKTIDDIDREMRRTVSVLKEVGLGRVGACRYRKVTPPPPGIAVLRVELVHTARLSG